MGIGVMASRIVGINGVAKAASAGDPYAVANELVCAALARAICLPCPPSFLVEKEGTPFHVSLDFNLSGHSLPPVVPAQVVQQQPGLSTGVILFDAWIVNPDRHNRNIAFDTIGNRLWIFDHSHAFMAGRRGTQHLIDNSTTLGIGGHCLAPAVTTMSEAPKWLDRIMTVPEFYIAEAMEMAADVGLPRDDRAFCVDFLCERRENLSEILTANRAVFPHVQPDLWN
jgi:hypothetical protein